VSAAEEVAFRLWLRAEHARAYEAALEWLEPRCRTVEERRLAPALLLLLASLNALVVPCSPVEGSVVNFQVTLSRPTAAGPVRVRLTVREAVGGRRQAASDRDAGAVAPANESWLPELWLDSDEVTGSPLIAAARVLEALLPAEAALGD
jgi:hypothetical protein